MVKFIYISYNVVASGATMFMW